MALARKFCSTRRSSNGSLCTHARVRTWRNCRPRAAARTANSCASGSNTVDSANGRGSATSPPASSREISSRPDSRSSVESSAPRIWRRKLSRNSDSMCCDMASVSSCAACRGWIRSWPTAVRKRVLATLARSASCTACSSRAVRSCTRRSRVSLLRLSASSARRKAVTSVKVAT
ncbi:hypothetical protein D3C71_1430310 [compost metagenome]